MARPAQRQRATRSERACEARLRLYQEPWRPKSLIHQSAQRNCNSQRPATEMVNGPYMPARPGTGPVGPRATPSTGAAERMTDDWDGQKGHATRGAPTQSHDVQTGRPVSNLGLLCECLGAVSERDGKASPSQWRRDMQPRSRQVANEGGHAHGLAMALWLWSYVVREALQQ